MKLNIVPARTGLTWVKLGMRTFFRQPLALAGLFFMFMTAVFLLALVPFLGQLLAPVLVPAATLGMMAAAQQASEGRFPMPTVLVSAFRAGQQQTRAMLVLGAIYAVSWFALVMLGMALAPDVASPAAVADGAGAATPAASAASSAEAAMPQASGAAFLLALLHLPLSVLFWHAPALVHWHGVSPVKSLFFSAVAIWRNLGAFLVYIVVWSLALMGVATLFVLLATALGGAAAIPQLVMPLALVFGAMFFSSIWFTFRDCFTAEAPSPDAPPPLPPGDPS